MKIQLGTVADMTTNTERPYYGIGPWWLCLWWHVCGLFYGQYWDAHRRLHAGLDTRRHQKH